ncbi:centriole and centriolar satellite protein OFD1-like [Uloborus diversus]|uniref:centriole and centriolar satellite protein OFD1-like n=1 Tax=Uloborus diversus TaxID=327109 RepID=UPI00240A435C|nr:centriole and centriolar satellite protein OFD1-like [Uloborus diversus]
MSQKQKIKKHLSADELKSKLYEHFEEIGSLEQIKAQLRGEIYTKLLKRTPNDFPETNRDLQNFDKMLLPLQVSNWLVFDHLLRQDHQYTLSTFTSEAKLSSPEKLLTACDILRLFGLQNTDSAYRIISRKYVTFDEKGVLNSLLLAVVKSIFEIPNKSFRLNELLNETEVKNIESKENSDNKNRNCQINNRTRTDDSPLTEKTSFTLHQYPADNKHSESTFHEQLQLIKNEKEKEVQKLREKLLEELDKLRAMQLELEHEKNDLRRQRTSISHDRDMFQEKKMMLEKEFESKFQKELMEIEDDFKSQLHLKETENDGLQILITILMVGLPDMKTSKKLFELEVDLRSYKERCSDLEKHLTDQREMYKVIQEKYSSLLEENIKLQRNFEGMSDYSIVKDELNIKLKENIELQNKLKEAVKNSEIEKQKSNAILKDLEQKLKTKDPELLQAQKELNFTKETLHKQETFWDRERKKLEQELQNSKQMYNTVFLRLEEQREDIQDLHKTIHFLQYQISNTFSVNKTKYEMPEMQHKYTTVESTRKGIQDLRTKNIKSLGDFASKYCENSLNFISEAKDRIDKLEKEAEMVKDKYSFLFSNTTHQTDLKYMDLNSTVPKTSFGNINSLPTNSYMSSTNFHLPSNYFDNLVKNEMSFLNLKTATNIKRMVSNSPFSTSLFSYSQQNEQIKNSNDQSNEITVDHSKGPLKGLQKDHVVLDNSFSEKEATSINDYAKEREDPSRHLFNYSTKMKTLQNEVTSASLNYNLTMPSGSETSEPLKKNEKFPQEKNESEKISKGLGDMQEEEEKISALIHESVTASGTQKSPILDCNGKEEVTVAAETSKTPPLLAIDLDVAWQQSQTLPEIPKKLDTVTVLEKNTISMETKDDTPALNFVVDLDAAWKRRKSSIVDLPFQNSSHNFKPQNKFLSTESNKSETILPKMSHQQDSLGENSQNLKQGVINTDTIQAPLERNEQKKTTAFEHNVSKASKKLDANLTEAVADLSTEKDSGDNNKSPILDHQVFQDIAMNQNENKSVKSGSGSELSDVHLSCGSEQEAKEDDFW